jgi:membrane protease YdiL (CAAX protease family)
LAYYVTDTEFQKGDLPTQAKPYSLVGVVGLMAAMFLIDTILSLVFAGHATLMFSVAPILSLVAVIVLIIIQRPKQLSLSRWRPKRIDLIAVPLGLLVAYSRLLFFADPVKYLSPPYLPSHSFFTAVLFAPALEEIIFRATFLNSLERSTSRLEAILIVTLLAAFVHGPANFLLTLPSQALLCLLYVGLRSSLAASILCHTCRAPR